MSWPLSKVIFTESTSLQDYSELSSRAKVITRQSNRIRLDKYASEHHSGTTKR